MLANIVASLEDVLAPAGEPASPIVGLQVSDWDENVGAITGAITKEGFAVSLNPKGVVALEAANNGIVTPDEVPRGIPGAAMFVYKGEPEDASEAIPIFVADNGKVQVSVEGKMKELAEFLGQLRDPDYVNDHEYR